MRYTEEMENRLFTYFDNSFKLKQSTKGFFRMDCPYCYGKGSFGINFISHLGHCFKCGEKQSAISIISHIEKLTTYQEVWKFLSLSSMPSVSRLKNRIAGIKPREQQQITLPESFTLISLGDSIYGTLARNYLKGRGFNIHKLSLQGIGYCTKGEYSGYIVFPFFQLGELVYFQGRRFIESAGPKMKNPDATVFGIGKESLIYNHDSLFMYKRISIVESITNALTLGNYATATLGKAVTQNQVTLFIKASFEKAWILFDSDEDNKAYIEGLKLGMNLSEYKEVKIIKMPLDKDVNDLGKKITLGLVKENSYLTYKQIYKLYLNRE